MSGSWQSGPWPLLWAAWWLIPLGLFLFFVIVPRHRHWGRPGPHPGGPGTREHALAILQERFARGEIDDDEYMRRKATLDSL
ncbi:MAG TPA: SHOCT domain-containing protein [Candidatus Dormibacteraeota bacterium]|nr:SHOCT domain-containing protein [Candidatus Dormibacteraeota bacterium]